MNLQPASKDNFQLRQAYTLIELILVVAIITTLGILSTAFYSRFLTQNAVDNTIDQLVGSLRKAQIYAMVSRKSGSSGWGVNYKGSSPKKIILFQGPNFATRNTALDEEFHVNENIAISGISEVNFARVSGLPSSSLTITVAGGNNSKTMTVNSGGVVSR